MNEPDRPARRISAKGHHRRRHLVTAAGEVLLQHGFAAVSHRSVAEHARLPLSATTYYFTSLDDLLAEALSGLADRWHEQARAVIESLPARLAGPQATADAIVSVATLASMGDASPMGVMVLYERYLEAARHPALRGAIATYDQHLDGLVSEILRRAGLEHDSTSARLVLAVVDGAIMRALAEGRDHRKSVAHVLTPMLEKLRT
jgi:DNA-binding transcriptional regulator YbjK